MSEELIKRLREKAEGCEKWQLLDTAFALREAAAAPSAHAPVATEAVAHEFEAYMATVDWDDEPSPYEVAERAFHAGRASAPAVPVGDGWIAVGDRLPEPQTDVLIFARHHQRPHVAQVMVAGLFGPHNNPRELEWMDNVSESMIPRRWWVTHWQPLPAAPAIANQEAQDGR